MTPSLILRYLFGHADAIRAVASSRAAFWTGAALVLITTIPRNYDQMFIAEKPLRWLSGSLAFSIVSGTWVFLVAYAACGWRKTRDAEGKRPTLWRQWPAFMGLFWITAPIAWLYAIPVERFLDSLLAAKVNVTLLAIVSFWRVALMARVFQCLCGVRYFTALLWVLTAALGETFVVTFFGGTMAKAIMAGMGGMRNSPEEEVLMSALGNAMGISFFGFPIVGVLTVVLNSMLRRSGCTPWPERRSEAVAGRMLAVCALTWAAVAAYPQVELSRNAKLERFTAVGQFRTAIEFMAARQPDDFAPSRPLPPKAFEFEVFKQLPQFIRQLKESDPEWVRRHFMKRLSEMFSHASPRRRGGGAPVEPDKPLEVSKHAFSYLWHRVEPASLLELFQSLERLPDGRAWLARNKTLVTAMKEFAESLRDEVYHRDEDPEVRRKHLRELRELLSRLAEQSSFPTPTGTNSPP